MLFHHVVYRFLAYFMICSPLNTSEKMVSYRVFCTVTISYFDILEHFLKRKLLCCRDLYGTIKGSFKWTKKERVLYDL